MIRSRNGYENKSNNRILAVFMLAMTACGTISPPIQTVETTTIPITAESLDSAVSSEVESTVNNEQVKSDTFIAEFLTQISALKIQANWLLSR